MTKLKVHSLQGIFDIYDYSSAASGMSYYNSNNIVGVTINGTTDAITSGALSWELVSGTQGSMFMVHDMHANVTLGNITSVYIDESNNSGADNCTGDNSAYGYSGVELVNFPSTDPNNAPGDYLTASRKITYLASGQNSSTISSILDEHDKPLQISTDCGTLCAVPTGLVTDQITSGSARVNWTFTGASSYTVYYREYGFTQWTETASVTGTFLTINGLSASTLYEWKVRSVCGSVESPYSAKVQFTSGAGCTNPPVPTGLTVTTTGNTANFSWDDVNVEKYHIQIYKKRKNGSLQLQHENSNVLTNSYSYTGLNTKSDYSFRVRSFCNSTYSSWTNYVDFDFSGKRDLDDLRTKVLEVEELSLNVYPNPTSGRIEIKIENANQERLKVDVMDLTGRMLKSESMYASGDNAIFIFDFSDYRGMVVILIKNDNEELIATKRILITE